MPIYLKITFLPEVTMALKRTGKTKTVNKRLILHDLDLLTCDITPEKCTYQSLFKLVMTKETDWKSTNQTITVLYDHLEKRNETKQIISYTENSAFDKTN
jgi:hypothetical protein